ncbi:fluoroquinolone export ABC transporter permease subunit [Pseudonocardia sichuanensis]|uniref:Fluoroquinolone transport system permease protein n=1 Tax=Pseudonocardia kunmingensis TaxID=630975 RepID=A0A543DKZ3_9PSEU|nr:fluoroquinolone transporter permease [Pseudonocardia kunmingensis]TQM09982.1 fluoroquinolone transport system permease protein [Pseudonocardia kunmingensis]
MSGVLATAVRMDFRLQRRYGFWYATAFVVLLWIGVLQLVPDHLIGPAMPYLLMADLEFMLFFIAGAVFFEKGERTVFALLTTPLRFRHYLTAKLLTMSALALVTCVVVVLVDYGPGVDPLPFLAGVLLMALLLLLAGFVTAPLFPSISEWILPSTLVLTVASVPLIGYSGLYPHPAFTLVPTDGPLRLLGAAFDQVTLTGWQWLYAVGYPALWIAGLCLLAKRVFHRYVVTSEGGR